MTVLRSYVGGKWVTPDDEGTPVHDAVTGDEVARVSTKGIDMRAALEHGRSVGGPALRELTFHQRAALLKALGGMLREHREELYAISARTGATLFDSRFDIDGGIGVVLSYASKAKRELPNEIDLRRGRSPSRSAGAGSSSASTSSRRCAASPCRSTPSTSRCGARSRSSRRPSSPACRRSIKPASQTAYLTSRMVELIVESGLLPDGALQYVCGSAGDLLDHLEEQDLLGFTGSASTAQRLRSHPTVVSRAVRFNAEADSLNCSILGPDATAGHARVRPLRQAAACRR